MENLEQQVLDLTISRQDNSRCWIMEIPDSLLTDILSRNPGKTVARSRCVSNTWRSILRGPDFTELFLSRSSSRPRLLFSLVDDESRLCLFSAPQPQNLDESSSLVAVADRHKVLYGQETVGICRPINGLVCTRNPKYRDTAPVICNPCTGQSITLPRLVNGYTKIGECRYFGYDPVDKLYKVLSMNVVISGRMRSSSEYYILTLGTKGGGREEGRETPAHYNMLNHVVSSLISRKSHLHPTGAGEELWREVKGYKYYSPKYDDGICINGVLYHPIGDGEFEEVSTIVCFDFRSEKFSYVKKPEGLEMGQYSILINYQGKLGALNSKRGIDYGDISDESTGFLKLWVLEYPEKHIWSTKTYQIPSMWRNVIQNNDVDIVGMTSRGEFVLSPKFSSCDPFYVFFYDPEKNIVVRVLIQGIERMEQGRIHTFVDYIEDVKLM